MSEISKAYEPQSVEDKWYDFWLKQGCFTADPKSAKPAYSIVIPPPNVTGMLHMGHVLNNTIQDILSRKARMDGKEVLWLPGTDHAGIATQVMVEKQIKKEEKKSRHDLGREEFLKRAWVWKEKHGDIIINQLKKLGCSCDWTRERFTMDPEYSRCVQKVFVELYKKGLIYRGKRMVNWCPVSQTALSDEEVEMKPQKGFMYHFKVQIAESSNAVIEEKAGLNFEGIKKGVTRENLMAAVKNALIEAAKKAVGPARELRVDMNAESGEIKVFAKLIVSDRVESKHDEISVVDARLLKADAKVGDEIEKEITPQGFGRIAAQYAKQALMQRVREAEKGQDERAAQIGGPVTDSEGRVWLTIATTRPETIPGDTAVAVNPKDPRYAHLIGKHIVRPLPVELPREQKLIPIIGDDHVDFEFGTGVLKVTPAHDKADFDIGTRHKLPLIEVINADGSMNDLAGADLRGLDRFKARKIAVEKLRELEMLVEEKPYENNVGFSQRADVPIEPRLSEQWFLKYPAVEQSKACVAEGRMKFHPDRWAKVYDHWLTNIQDWCISRQLWWGHQVPVWRPNADWGEMDQIEKTFAYIEELKASGRTDCIIRFPETGKRAKKDGKGESIGYNANELETSNPQKGAEDSKEDSDELTGITVEFCLAPGADDVKVQIEKLGFEQDPDVLDTWFSSWLWPFATMGWPEQTETLKKFYPTTDLVTGPDIIFFWVARMIMAGYEFMGEAESALPKKFALPDAMPFQNVYFTGIIRDKQGRKMSKTLGNSPDPLVLIAQYGADALRFGTMRSAPLGQDVLFDENDVELGRNFCNKLWNACRFRQMQGGEVQGEIERTLLTPDDKWILLKLDAAIREVTIALNEYKFSEATSALYKFFWSEYCDWYVEASKASLPRPIAEVPPPSPIEGERAGVRGQDVVGSSEIIEAPNEPSDPSPSIPLPSEGRGRSDAEARKANTLAVIDFVLSHAIRMFHPFLPFITEELWHGMGYSTDMPENQGGKTIMNAPWPLPFDDDFKGHYGLDDCYLEMTDTKYELIRNGRDLRRAGNIQAAKKVDYVFEPAQQLTSHDKEVIQLLLNSGSLHVVGDFAPPTGSDSPIPGSMAPNASSPGGSYSPPKGTPVVASPLGKLFLPLEGLIDVAAEKTRLTKEVEKIQSEIVKVEQKLANPNFTTKVPPAVLVEHEQRLADWKNKLAHAQASLDALG